MRSAEKVTLNWDMEEELASQNPRGKAIYVQGAVKRVSTSLSQKEVGMAKVASKRPCFLLPGAFCRIANFCLLLAVLVECSHHNFRVVVNRALFYEDELIGPDELFLGTGCVAIHVRPNELEFNYPVSFCGIVPQVRAASIVPSVICKVVGSVAFPISESLAIFYFNKIHCCDKLACVIKDLFSHQIFYDGSVSHSWLTYRPRNQVISTELHLQCLVPRSVQNITGSLPEYQ
ncbi:uncharacterized protein LOC144254177 [Urocitellus parryii]